MFEDLIKEKIIKEITNPETGCYKQIWKNVQDRKFTEEKIRKFIEAVNDGSIF